MRNRQFFPKTLPQKTAKLVQLIQEKKPDFLNNFYLSGGTALSLQIGHRESEDLDFFNQNHFSSQKIQQDLEKLGKPNNTELAKGTVNTFLNDVQLQFLEYPYDLLRPTIKWQSIKLSSIEDIACTKLQTIGMRGSKKDFVDLYFLLELFSLDKLFKLMQKKYSKTKYSKTHIMKALTCFEDAQKQPMPRMHKNLNWDDVKKKMIEAIKSVKF